VEKPRHLKDVMREIHGRLVREGIRDEITLIVAGGIALAEHMAKAIICGADLVAADHRIAGGARLPRLSWVQDADHQDHCPPRSPSWRVPTRSSAW